jgi:hypothetical protein
MAKERAKQKLRRRNLYRRPQRSQRQCRAGDSRARRVRSGLRSAWVISGAGPAVLEGTRPRLNSLELPSLGAISLHHLREIFEIFFRNLFAELLFHFSERFGCLAVQRSKGIAEMLDCIGRQHRLLRFFLEGKLRRLPAQPRAEPPRVIG